MNAEHQLGWLARTRPRFRGALVATAHQPPGWYRLRHPSPIALAGLDALIVFESDQASWLEGLLPGPVHVVPLGVDVAFFAPAPEPAARERRVLFAGSWLRDVETLSRVVDRVLARDPGVRFDAVVPRTGRRDPALQALARHPQVSWHARGSDDELRAHYRGSDLLLLPMIDCAGCSTLVEAIACGLPVVSNDVGAMRETTRPDFAELHARGDADAMADSVLALLAEPDELEKRGRAARAFAEAELSLERSARATLRVYDSVLSEADSLSAR
jgi:glycosyltransferase involved in cell wall biosynthesis